MTSPQRRLAGAALCVAFVFSACSSATNPPGATLPETVTQKVGSSGGTIQAKGAALKIPAGALSQDTEITVAKSADPAPQGYAASSVLYQLSPSGLTFSSPADLTLDFNGNGAGLAVFLTKVTGSGFDQIAGVINGSTITAPISHFSSAFAGQATTADGGTTPVPDGGTPASGVALSDYYKAVIAAICTQHVNCHLADSVTACSQYYDRVNASIAGGGLFNESFRGIDAGRIAYNPDAVKRCLDLVSASTACNSDDQFETLRDCRDAVHGLAAVGAACFVNRDCVDAAYCNSTNTSCPGTCVARKALNETTANGGEDCVRGLYYYNGVCKAPIGMGASCAAAAPATYPQQCVTGSFCDRTTLICLAGYPVGHACAGDAECQAGTNCASGADAGNSCASTVMLNGTCNELSRNLHCKEGLFCDQAGQADGVCKHYLPRGTACFQYQIYFCEGGLYCSGDYTTAGTCQQVKTVGSACTPLGSTNGMPTCVADAFCQSDAGVCVTKHDVGESCASKDECAPDTYCNEVTHKCVLGSCRAP